MPLPVIQGRERQVMQLAMRHDDQRPPGDLLRERRNQAIIELFAASLIPGARGPHDLFAEFSDQNIEVRTVELFGDNTAVIHREAV